MDSIDRKPSQTATNLTVVPTPAPCSTPAGHFTTPVLKRRRVETSQASEQGARLKRRPLTLASAELQQKERQLQELRLVSHYRRNHSLAELAELTRRWREAAQQALADLRRRLEERGRPTDMAQLLRHLGIDPCLVRYDPEEEAFREPNGP